MNRNKNGADCANGAIGVDCLDITNYVSVTDCMDEDNELKEIDCVDITCVSVRARSATSTNCLTFLIGKKGKMITDGADFNYRNDNGNGVNCT